MTNNAKPIPEGFHSVTPYIVVHGAAKAIEFYQHAFNAKELSRFEGPDGKIIHATIKIGDSVIMLSDELPDSNKCGMVAPSSINKTTVTLQLYVENVDKVFEQAIKTGAKVQMPVTDMFWGDRYSQVVDPFGHVWAISTQKEKLSEAEIKQRAVEFFKASKYYER